MEANQQWTVISLFQNVWETNQDSNLLKEPVTWLAIHQFVQEKLSEQNQNDLEDAANYERSILRITKAWQRNYSQWQIASFSDLQAKAGNLLAGSFQTSLSTTTWENALLWSNYCLQQDLITDEICSGLLPTLTATTSILSTTVASATGAVDAPGDRKSLPNFRDLLNKLSEKDGLSATSKSMTGSMSSFITACESGESPRKYGLNEKIKDYRLHLSLYDGRKCKENPQKFWLAMTDGFQVTYSKKETKIKEAVQTLLDLVGSTYAGKQLSLISSTKRYKPY